MSYSVEWHPKTRKFLKKLPNDISARIVLKVKEVTEEGFMIGFKERQIMESKFLLI